MSHLDPMTKQLSRGLSTALLFSILCVSPVTAQQLKPWVDEHLSETLELYYELHQSPELSFEEEETAQRVGKAWKEAGYEVTYEVGGFGVVGVLKNGDGPMLMLRTDLDALPVVEQTPVGYASKKEVEDADGRKVGVMHACGHDIHMANLVAVARFMSDHRDLWSGTLMVIGQPAEERGSGASAMLKDGLFDRFGKPDFAIALHVDPTRRTGDVAVRAGYSLANVDSVDVIMKGKGGHGAYPHTTIDPVVQAAQLVMDLQTIVSREISPLEPGVITVGSIHGGTKHNIIGNDCHLQLTVRSYTDEVREKLLSGIKRKAEAVAMGAGAEKPEIEISEGTPSVLNDADLAGRLRTIFADAIGESHVKEAPQVMGGEDFSQYGRAGVPIVMYWLGTIDPKRLERYEELGVDPPSLHSPKFYPDAEECLRTGTMTMAAAALELLKSE